MQPLAFKPTPTTGWWGAGYFVSVGAMGGVEEEKTKIAEENAAARKLGFDEDDQAALYMQVCACLPFVQRHMYAFHVSCTNSQAFVLAFVCIQTF
jgi:hypothetical protein